MVLVHVIERTRFCDGQTDGCNEKNNTSPDPSRGVGGGGITLCLLGNFSCFWASAVVFFKINFFEKFFQE